MKTYERMIAKDLRYTKTAKAARKKLHEELELTNAAFDKHMRKYNCKVDGCVERAKFQERIQTLEYVIIMMGGRIKGGVLFNAYSTIDEL